LGRDWALADVAPPSACVTWARDSLRLGRHGVGGAGCFGSRPESLDPFTQGIAIEVHGAELANHPILLGVITLAEPWRRDVLLEVGSASVERSALVDHALLVGTKAHAATPRCAS